MLTAMIYDGVLPDPALTSHTLQYQHQHRRRHQQQKFGMYDLGKHPLGAAASSYYKAVMVLALALDLALALALAVALALEAWDCVYAFSKQ